jgi:cytochrome c553
VRLSVRARPWGDERAFVALDSLSLPLPRPEPHSLRLEADLHPKTVVSTSAVVVLLVALSGCAPTPGPGLARGAQVYDTCVPCHGAQGLGNATLGAPEIAGLPEWYVSAQLRKFKTSLRGAHPDDDAGQRMRPMARSLYREGDVESVAQYVATLAPVRPHATLAGGDAAAGATRYTTICTTCHGPAAAGNQAIGAPPLDHQADWYMLAQLAKFKGGLRGAHPDDVTGAQMAAMSQTLEDSTAMRDVIAYIRTLQQPGRETTDGAR